MTTFAWMGFVSCFFWPWMIDRLRMRGYCPSGSGMIKGYYLFIYLFIFCIGEFKLENLHIR